MNKNKKYYILIIVAAAIIVTLLFVPVKLPYSVESFGKIIPIRQWILIKGNDGELILNTVNNKTGTSDGYKILQISRGETMSFTINSSIVNNGFVEKGDTIGTIYSSEAEERLATLSGQLLTTEAKLAVSTIGQKESIIREVEQRLSYVKTAAAEQQKILNRLQNLYKKEMISTEEYENELGKEKLLQIEISIAEAELEAATTGEKKETIKLFNSQIAAVKQEINVLQKRLNSFSITSPFSGKVSKVFSSDTLLLIKDTSAYVALIPLRLNDCSYVCKAQEVKINDNNLGITNNGRLIDLDDEINILSGEQIRVATALFKDNPKNLLTGMVSHYNIYCEPVTMLEYVKRFLISFLG